jgi:tetratricopeptide (TPR) repeat protein
MRNAAIVFSIIVLLSVGASGQTPPADTVTAADAAFNQGKIDEALRLYNAILAQHPDDVMALTRTGMLHSWRKDFTEAVRRFDRVLAIDPKNAMVRMERAKVLSWAKEYGKAEKAFREILASEPNNVDAQLGLSRTLSWSGNQKAARIEYQHVLDRDPKNVDAIIGVAQTYAWSGDSASARTWYAKALEIQPDRREAILGLAYVDLGEGDVFYASQRTSQLESRFPADVEVRDLRAAVSHASAPTFRLAYDHTDDTDENETDLVNAEATMPLPHRADMSIGYARYELSDSLSREGTAHSAFVSFLLRPSSRQRLTLRGGVDRLEKTDGSSTNEPTGRIGWAAGMGGKVEATLDAERRPFRATTVSLDNEIMLDAYTAGLYFRPVPSVRLNGNAGVWRFSDSNQRNSFDAGISYVWPLKPLRVETGYAYHYFDYDKAVAHGYFDPQNFHANAFTVDLNKEFRTVYAHGFVETGWQSFEFRGTKSDRDRYLTWAAILGFRLTPLVSLEFAGIKSNSSIQNPSGFESTEYAARLRFQTR